MHNGDIVQLKFIKKYLLNTVKFEINIALFRYRP